MQQEWWIDKWKIGTFSVSYLIFLFTILLGIPFLLYKCISNVEPAPTLDRLGDVGVKTLAQTLCHPLIEAKLRSPKSADFPWLDNSAALDSSRRQITYNSYVDAQNAFGATIRTYFTCTLRLDGMNESNYSQWSVSNITYGN